jgi:hypothetical protein
MNYADLAEERKVVTKQLQDADKQLLANMQMIQSLNCDKEWKQKELDELEITAHVVAEMVNPMVDRHTLLERLHDAPRSIAGYASRTAKVVLAHVLGLIKSYHPTMEVKPLADGAAEGCTEEQFNEYCQEVEPMAYQIVMTCVRTCSDCLCSKNNCPIL